MITEEALRFNRQEVEKALRGARQRVWRKAGGGMSMRRPLIHLDGEEIVDHLLVLRSARDQDNDRLACLLTLAREVSAAIELFSRSVKRTDALIVEHRIELSHRMHLRGVGRHIVLGKTVAVARRAA